jgi:hypothetical protein
MSPPLRTHSGLFQSIVLIYEFATLGEIMSAPDAIGKSIVLIDFRRGSPWAALSSVGLSVQGKQGKSGRYEMP